MRTVVRAGLVGVWGIGVCFDRRARLVEARLVEARLAGARLAGVRLAGGVGWGAGAQVRVRVRGAVTAMDVAAVMLRALHCAGRALEAGDVPVGAVVLDPEGQVVGEGWNTREADLDPAGHAEIMAMRAAAMKLSTWRLEGCTLVVTLEPCPMCAGAAMQARVARIVLGAWDPKLGACGSVWDVVRDRQSIHRVEVVSGVLAPECRRLLTDFFQERRF